MIRLLSASLALVGGLASWGAHIDATLPLRQLPLFAGLQGASLLGALLGAAAFRLHRRDQGSPGLHGGLQAVVTLLAWRVSYFPIMVFSGHLASIGEWLLIRVGAPVVVYPVFLVSAAALHALAAGAAAGLLDPPRRGFRALVAPVFLVAVAVSFSRWSDISLLPDRNTSLEGPVPLMHGELGNPYLEALRAPGYLPNQRVLLLAAGLTCETIPPSPWATTVKSVLEGLFLERPFGTTQDRILEHYLAYHSAQVQIGCRALADCPPDAP